MRRKILAAVLLAFLAAPAQAADWWWIGLNGEAPHRALTYLDRATVAPAKDGLIEVWTLVIGESPLPNGQQHQANHYALDCRSDSYAALGRIVFDRDAEVMPVAELPPGAPVRAEAGSIGESILQLACGRPAGTEVRVEDPLSHGLAYLSRERQGPATAPPEAAAERSGLSVGTGFFIGPNGHILTSHHVIAGAQRLACRSQDGRIHEARVARLSPASDLALLQVDFRPARYLGFAPPGSIRPGDRVFTIGYGAAAFLGIDEPRFTDGTVSALSGPGAENAYMQISVPVQPGNSGGPLVNEAGQVVGIIAAQAATEAFFAAEGTLPQNINWAVKAEYAAPLMSPLAAAARLTRDQAIDLARHSICLVIADRGGE